MNLELLKQAVSMGLLPMEEVKRELLNRIFSTPASVPITTQQEKAIEIPVSNDNVAAKRVYVVRSIADAIVQVVHLKGRPIGTKEIRATLKELGYTYKYTTIIQGAGNFPPNHIDPLGRSVVRTRNGSFGHYIFSPA